MIKKSHILSFLLLVAVAVANAQTLRIAGSDLVASALETPLREFSKIDELNVSITMTGSSIARRQLLDGTVDLAIIASPDGKVPADGFVSIPLAFQVVALVVHESNPIQQLSLSQLAAIFGQGGAVNIEDWGSLGATGVWRARKINLQAIRKRNNVALELFKAQVLGEQEIRGNVTYWGSTQALAARIIEDNTSIAIMSTAQQRPLAKILSISRADGEQSFSPSPDNVLFGDYPLRMPFYLLYREGSQYSNEALNSVLRFLLSDEVAQLLTAAEFMPLVDAERRQHMDDLDN